MARTAPASPAASPADKALMRLVAPLQPIGKLWPDAQKRKYTPLQAKHGTDMSSNAYTTRVVRIQLAHPANQGTGTTTGVKTLTHLTPRQMPQPKRRWR
ncbi:hypothetical protein FRC08_018349 [Ceratobasidium sp. 394]|nr:hypothetical protein FRC08_018349 [Ceratobasidium sp. 394]KAG9091108.1 hypothetical protein FS749_016789 [Ceratobasidium sp. UAMH 11750]